MGNWLKWAREIQAISQAGLEYSRDPFDVERFQQLRSISVDIMAHHTSTPVEKIKEVFANESGYQTPKVDIRAVVPHQGKILLVQERDHQWALPGGWADIHLTVKENARKEVMEEAGIQVEPQKIIALLDRESHLKDNYPYAVYKIFVLCQIRGKQNGFRENSETLQAQFFSIDELPELSQTRNTTGQLKMCFNYMNNPQMEPLFD